MRAQIKQVGENLREALEAAGCRLADLVKTTTFVTNIDEFFRRCSVLIEMSRSITTAGTKKEWRL